MNIRKLGCHKVFGALRLSTRVRILQEPIKTYPNTLTIPKLQEITSESRMSILFHINRLRESDLVGLDGSRRGFMAATRALAIGLNGNRIHWEEM